MTHKLRLTIHNDYWRHLQALKLGKDLEMLLKEQRGHQAEHQAEVAALTERLRLAEESREKLAVEVTTLQGRFNLDLDEKMEALQKELEVILQFLCYSMIPLAVITISFTIFYMLLVK